MEIAEGGWPVYSGQFAPFGGELKNGTPLAPDQPDGSTSNYKVTGKERDTESGLDYFGARYYASTMGRFMTPDWSAKPAAVPYASFGDPQTLNLYSYAQNGPVNRVDADGHQVFGQHGLAYQNQAPAFDRCDFEINGGCTGDYLIAHGQAANEGSPLGLSEADDEAAYVAMVNAAFEAADQKPQAQQQESLSLFPTQVAVDPGSVNVNWRLRNSNGKSRPKHNYLVFEHLDHCGAAGTVCQGGGAIGPAAYGASQPSYADNDPNVFRDGYVGTAGGNTIQSFTIQLMKGSKDLTYDPARQLPVDIQYGGQHYGSQGIYHGPGGRATVYVNGYSNLPSVPLIPGEY